MTNRGHLSWPLRALFIFIALSALGARHSCRHVDDGKNEHRITIRYWPSEER